MKKILIEDIKRIKELMFQDDEIEMDEDSFDDETYEEMTEDGEETNTTSSGAGPSQGYPTVTKWESGRTLGPTYKGPNSKWESGLTRGKANTLI
jgi:hypothetical protein